MLGPGRFLGVLGGILAIGGISLIWVGFQRARFRGAGDGPGSVVVDEGQITYFGPLTGGAIAVADIAELALLRSTITEHWRLSTAGGDALYIPSNAEGADALFDAFSALPGLKTERLVQARTQTDTRDIVIWQADDVRGRTNRLN